MFNIETMIVKADINTICLIIFSNIFIKADK